MMFDVLSFPSPYYFTYVLEENRFVQHIYVISQGFVLYDEGYHVIYLLDFLNRVSNLFSTSDQ